MKAFINAMLAPFRKDKLAGRASERPPGLRQTSGRYGGMGERELQLRMEMIVERSITDPNRNLFDYAKQLAGFGIIDQKRFLKAVKRLYSKNDELAYHFCCNSIRALKELRVQDWETWLQTIETQQLRHGTEKACAYIDDLDGYIQKISLPPQTATLDELAAIIERLISAFGGRRMNIRSGKAAYTDTDTLFLPSVCSHFDNYDDNFYLYKVQATFLWAQARFGTWQIDINRLLYDYSDFDQALPLFLRLENLRLDACIERELPGIARLMSRLGRQADKLPDNPEWRHAAEHLSRSDAKAQDSLDLVEKLLSKPLPEPTLYQGVFKVEETLSAIRARLSNDKEDLHKALEKYLKDLKSDEQKSDRWKLEVYAGEADEYELTLSYDDQALEITPEVQKLLESIIQDLGEIPEEYLHIPQSGRNENRDGNKARLDIEDQASTCLPEWDYSIQQYRPDWCRIFMHDGVMGDSNRVRQTLAKHRHIVKRLKQTFEALRESDIRLARQYDGDEIDLDAAIESYIATRSETPPNQDIYLRTRKQDRDIAVMFMVDMSDSTRGWINALEKESLALLCESLEVLGDSYAIYGFSTRTRKQCDIYRIKTFEESYGSDVCRRIDGLNPCGYTRMGAAIRYLRNLLLESEAKTRIIITLSDGKPDDQDGYRGQHGIEDTRRALLETSHLGIHPYCITIDTKAMNYLPYMYGDANFSVVSQVDQLPFKVSEIYRKITS